MLLLQRLEIGIISVRNKSMSVTVLYNGQKKKIKASPISPVQQIVEEAMQLFGVSASKMFDLHHNRKPIERSQPFRFSGIPNNATLDLVEVKAKSGQAADSRIALSAEGFGQMSGVFK